MNKVTFLGPLGTTFSHDAYVALSGIFSTPEVTHENYVPAGTNGEVLKLIRQRGGYGAIAMETRAEGRVAEPLEAFIELLKTYQSIDQCPLHIVGAVRMKISFCLLTRPGIKRDSIKRILAHQKAIGPCKGSIEAMNATMIAAPSNGEAARLVAQSEEHADCAALGPASAAEKYGLQILDSQFENQEAVTTFFLIAPRAHKRSVGKENRVLIVFKVPQHKSGALVRCLIPFDAEGLNLIQIHSVHVGNSTYNFVIEIEAKDDQLEALDRAMKAFSAYVEEHLTFGPFQVTSR